MKCPYDIECPLRLRCLSYKPKKCCPLVDELISAAVSLHWNDNYAVYLEDVYDDDVAPVEIRQEIVSTFPAIIEGIAFNMEKLIEHEVIKRLERFNEADSQI